MLEGVITAGFYSCFYGSGRRAALAGAGAAGLALAGFCFPEIRCSVPILTALWLMLTGALFQTRKREELLLAGGVWLLARSLGGIAAGQTGIWRLGQDGVWLTGAMQTVIAAAFFGMTALYLLGRASLYPLWMAVLAALWLLTGFLGGISYAEPWQEQVMAASLYAVAGGILIFQQGYCVRLALEHVQWKGDFSESGAYSDEAGSWRESARQEYGRLRIFEHDFRHHLDMVAAMYEEGAQEEAREYIKDVKRARVSRQGIKNGGERELVYMMLAKKEACRQAQISFSYQIVGSPRGIAQTDMTALMLNLLDNAIRACREVPEPRSIGVMLLSRGELWEIEMVNSGRYEPEETQGKIREEMGVETAFGRKSGAEGRIHGIGMVSVKQIVEKYQGTYRIWQEEGQVRQKLILVQRCFGEVTIAE